MNLRELLETEVWEAHADDYIYAYLNPKAYNEFKNEPATLSLFKPFWVEKQDISFDEGAPFDASNYVYGYYDSASTDAVFELMDTRHRTHAEFSDYCVGYLVFPYSSFHIGHVSGHPAVKIDTVHKESEDGSAVIGIKVKELM